MPRVVVTANAFAIACPGASSLLTEAGVDVALAPVMGPLQARDLSPLLEGVDVVIASSDAYTPEVLRRARDSCLKGIVRWGVGVDSIDLAAAADLGIVVANIPGSNTQSVADYAFALLLQLARDTCGARQILESGQWRQAPGVELWRKTMGIIGFGAIGRAVCRRARGFEMRVLAYDPNVSADAVEAAEAETAGLDHLLRESDFISLHASLTPETAGIIDESALRTMKPSAYLLNAGRGGLVDEAALLRALGEGWIAGAGLDCFSEEPLSEEHPFRRLKGFKSTVFTTPHIAFNTAEVTQRTNEQVVEAVLDILAGRLPRNTVTA